MESWKLTRNPAPAPMAAVCKSEPSSHFATDIYLPSVRLQQRNSREQELGQIKIALQHYLLPSHMRSHPFNGYFKLKQLLKHPVARVIIFSHINRYLEKPEK